MESIITDAEQLGAELPVLLCFDDILVAQMSRLRDAFDTAIRQTGYRGDYLPVYPIKVNQDRSVLQAFHDSGIAHALECGSKAELLAIMASSLEGSMIICNGVKDRAYIALALLGRSLGLDSVIVVEKHSELEQVVAIADELGVEPRLGLRLRLASVTSGQWQNSGGLRAKFGFTPDRFLKAVAYLETRGLAGSLEMIHFHPGSQISDLRHIRQSVNEAMQFVLALSQRGIRIPCLNAGGGLGLDYQGNGCSDYFSVNYSFDDYARTLIDSIKAFCDRHQLDQPAVLTESGRAMTAHHAVLVTDVLDTEQAATRSCHQDTLDDTVLADLSSFDVGTDLATMIEDVDRQYRDGIAAFASGELDLAARARLDLAYLNTLERMRQQPRFSSSECPEQVRQRIVQLTTDKYFLNFSVFRSIPDSWAIGQLFPIVPLTRLDERADRAVVLEDITCDSDGRIDQYISPNGPVDHLLLHQTSASERYLIGIFMVGAYQEILGDNHNLLGLTDRVRVADFDGSLSIRVEKKGQTVGDVLADVGHDRDTIIESLRQKLMASQQLNCSSDHPDEAILKQISDYLELSTYPQN